MVKQPNSDGCNALWIECLYAFLVTDDGQDEVADTKEYGSDEC